MLVFSQNTYSESTFVLGAPAGNPDGLLYKCGGGWAI